MSILGAVWLLGAMVGQAQTAPAMPDVWQNKADAAARAQLDGKLARAEALLLEVVREAEKLGRDDLRLAEPLEKLAHFYLSSRPKRHQDAERLARRALTIRERAQGADHPDVAATLCYMAFSQDLRTGHCSDAAGTMLWRALAILERAKGPDDPDVANALLSLALWHWCRNDFGSADAALARAGAIYERAFGEKSAKVAKILDELGTVHFAQSRNEVFETAWEEDAENFARSRRQGMLAESFYCRALAIREEALPPGDRAIRASLFHLGQLAMDRGNLSDGEKYLGRCLALDEQAKAPPSEELGKVLSWLGEASTERGDFDLAEHRLARAQTVMEQVKGSECDEVSIALAMCADVAVKAGQFDRAEPFLKRAFDIQIKHFDASDPDMKAARSLLARSYRDVTDDAAGPSDWRELHVLADRFLSNHHREMHWILFARRELLRRTNRVKPPPTRDDLDYLRQTGAVVPYMTLDILATTDRLWGKCEALDDEGLSHVARLYDLLHLSANADATDAGLDYLADLDRLEDVDLSGSRISDAGLAKLKGLKSLRWLTLDHTQITDAGLEQVKALERLQVLRVQDTKVTPAAIYRLRKERPALNIVW